MSELTWLPLAECLDPPVVLFCIYDSATALFQLTSHRAKCITHQVTSAGDFSVTIERLDHCAQLFNEKI